MGTFFQTRFYPSALSSDYVVLSAMDRVLNSADMERGSVRWDALLKAFPDKLHAFQKEQPVSAWVAEYMWTTHEGNPSPLTEVRRLPVT